MTKQECIGMLAEDMTEAATLEVLIDYYYASMEKWLKSLTEEELTSEYEDWFEPDLPIVLEEVSDEV